MRLTLLDNPKLLMGTYGIGKTAPAPDTPRFIVFWKRLRWEDERLRFRVFAVESLPGQYVHSVDRRKIKRVLYRSKPIFTTASMNDVPVKLAIQTKNYELINTIDRAKRVVDAMNRMRLAVASMELEEDGIQQLFDRLWSEDEKEYGTNVSEHI